MRKIQTAVSGLVVLAALLPFSVAQAQTGNGPKPLTADIPSPTSEKDKAVKKPGELPKEYQEYVKRREEMKGEYNAWLKDDQAIQKECEAPQTPAEHAECDRKAKKSQERLDKVHEHTRDMLRKLDTWRRKSRGLPPPDWWPEEKKDQNNQQNSGASNGGAAGTTQSVPSPDKSPVLLPQQPKALPAGTF